MNIGKTLAQMTGLDPHHYEVVYRLHATNRMFNRGFTRDDVMRNLETGIVAEEYPDDFPFPSILLNGVTANGRPTHLVAGIDSGEKRLYIITVYEPDSSIWTDRFSKRKRV